MFTVPLHAVRLVLRRRCAGRALLLLGMAWLGACAPAGDRAALPADTLVRVSDNEVRSLDPQKISDLASLRVASDQFEGLTRYAADGRIIPGIATDWTASADGLRWTFRLDRRRRFSDGTPIDAATFAKGFARLRDPATAAPTASLFDGLTAVRAAAPDRVEVQLTSPFPTLPALMAHPAVAALPLHRIAAKGEAWVDDRPLVTSGPYRTQGWTLNERLDLAANPAWPAATGLVPKVQWRPVDDSLAALRIFRAGAADTLADFPAVRLEELRRDMPDAVHLAPMLGTYYLAFNTRRPPFADRRIRQALSLATDRAWIAKNIVGAGSVPACVVIPPQLRPQHPVQCGGEPLAARRQQAAELLRAAGYGPHRPLVVEIRFNSAAEHRRIAVALAAMWRPLGVDLRLLNSEASLHFAALKRGDFMLARSGWIADIAAPENFLAVHRSDAGAINYSGFADPAYDAMLATAMNEPDAARREAKMVAADAYLSAEAPILPLYHYSSRALVSPRVTGWVDNHANVHPSATLGLRR